MANSFKAAPVGSLILEPRLRRISRNVVDTKWGPLPEGAQDRVKELFSSVERPVLIRIAEGRRRKEAEVALESVLRRFVFVLLFTTSANFKRCADLARGYQRCPSLQILETLILIMKNFWITT